MAEKITDAMLEEMGFALHLHPNVEPCPLDTFTIDRNRLKAGVAGARYALQELQFDLNHFPEDEITPAKQRLIDEINNLKTFLGVVSETESDEE